MTLFDLLAQSAARRPEAPAVSYHDEIITYGELLAAAEGFAAGLASLGAEEGARVALLLPNCPPFVIAYLGASRAGAVVIPINVLYRPDEARFILADSQARILITAEPFRPLVQAIRPNLPDLEHVVMVGESPLADEIGFQDLCARPMSAATPARDDDVAVILYTSGSTGRPKGAMLTHNNLVANANSCRAVLHITGEDCFFSALPLFHSFAAMVFLTLPIKEGARMHIVDRFLPTDTLNEMERSGVTVFGGVPTMFGLMLQAPRETRPDLASLRLCISGGAPLPPEVWRAFEETFDVKLVEGYGLTEASPVVAVNPPEGIRKPGSVGPAVPGVEVKVVDEGDRPVERGEVGELAIRGGNVMKGYLDHPEETARTIRDSWLFTGDLVREDEDGYLYIAGRKKELIIVGGLNVYPGEVDRVLVEHPAVMEAAAFGAPDPVRGEAVWAAVVLRPDMSVSEREIRQFCRDKLAAYKVPRHVEIRADLPKTALGKVARHVLRDEALKQINEQSAEQE
jgi:long-chain acyl-CoA synthetase